MNNIAGAVGATGLALMTAICPQETAAEGFNGTEFLTWPEAAQDSYIQSSVTMAAIMATKTRKASGDCLADWYLSQNADQDERNDELRATIARNGTYHPSSVIFLVLEKACGPFVDAAN